MKYSRRQPESTQRTDYCTGRTKWFRKVNTGRFSSPLSRCTAGEIPHRRKNKDLVVKTSRGLIGNVNQQEAILFNDSFFNNIAFGVNNATMGTSRCGCQDSQCHDFIYGKQKKATAPTVLATAMPSVRRTVPAYS